MTQNTKIEAYNTLTLIKRLGKFGGFSAQMVNLLDYYLSYTRKCDWEEGGQPIIYQSLCNTARDMGLSVRQIQRLEKSLHNMGVLKWKDSPNNKRYGSRTKNGHILSAYGVDLSPLVISTPAIIKKLEEKQRAEKAWKETKLKIHRLRKLIRELAPEDIDKTSNIEEKGALTSAIRASMSYSSLKSILSTLISLYRLIKKELFSTTNDDKNVVHKELTTCNKYNNLSKIGLDNITLSKLNNYTKRLKQVKEPMNWDHLLDYCEKQYPIFGISNETWMLAQKQLSRVGAALSLLIIIQGISRKYNIIKHPEAYLNALIGRAQSNELYLDKSIF